MRDRAATLYLMTFYFYDLETSSGTPRSGRIMQFAGQRTNEDMEPIGKPDNILVKLSDDFLPEPDAVLVHGITPQKANDEGITEAELASYFNEQIATPGTVFIGYNNLRFDDEFIRYLNYRTFHDPYQWHWKDDRSRWDLLDPMRMMRALRPEGLKWPELAGKPTVKLELMAKENGLLHENAHDALSDVQALIQLASAFKKSQPKLFEFLMGIRGKKEVAKLIESSEPFVYTSGRYDNEYLKTAVVKSLIKHPRRDAAIVYDLRHDPREWLEKTPEELVRHWNVRYGDDTKRLPVKTVQYNHCPAVAPLSVLDDESKKRIGYSEKFMEHAETLQNNAAFIKNVEKALDIIENEQQARLPLTSHVDAQLYDGFWEPAEQSLLAEVRHAPAEDVMKLAEKMKSKRMRSLLPLYKARNYPKALTSEERIGWENYRRKQLLGGGEASKAAKFYSRMQTIAKDRTLTSDQEYLLNELQLYVESILPEPEDSQLTE